MLIHSRIKMVLLFVLGAAIAGPVQALTTKQAGPVIGLVRQETIGTDNAYTYALVYHRYELINPYGGGRLLEFSIGAARLDPSSTDPNEPSVGTLTRLPTGTTWSMAPALSLDYPTTPRGMPALPHPAAGFEIPIPTQGSVTALGPLRIEIDGAVREPNVPITAEDIAEERYAINWKILRSLYGIPYDHNVDGGGVWGIFKTVIGRVLVPRDSTVGPGSVGSLANYTQGEWEAELWGGMGWMAGYFVQTKYRGKLIVSPSALVSFTSDLLGTENNGVYKVGTQNSNPLTITANIVPLHVSDTVPTFRLESIACRGECLPNEGFSGAAFGTDDRTFQLQGTNIADGSPHNRYFDITYLVSSVEGTNRATSTVLVEATIQPPPPPPPSSISARLSKGGTLFTVNVAVAWSATTGSVTRYELQEYLATIANPACNITATSPIVYSGMGLTANFSRYAINKQCYRVRACNGSNCGDFGPTVFAQ